MSYEADLKKDLDVIEMSLCEATRVFLKPNQLYWFEVVPGCAGCEAVAAIQQAPRWDSENQHPEHPLGDWIHAVADYSTCLGYHDWVEHLLIEEAEGRAEVDDSKPQSEGP